MGDEMKLDEYRYFTIRHSAEEIATFLDDTDRLCWNTGEMATNKFINVLRNVGAKYIHCTLRMPLVDDLRQVRVVEQNILALDPTSYLKMSLVIDKDETTSSMDINEVNFDAIYNRLANYGNDPVFIIHHPSGNNTSWTQKQMKDAGYGPKPVAITAKDTASLVEISKIYSTPQVSSEATIKEPDLFAPSTGLKAFKTPPRPEGDPLLERQSWIEKLLGVK